MPDPAILNAFAAINTQSQHGEERDTSGLLPPSIVRSAAVAATVHAGTAHAENFLSAQEMAAVGCCNPSPQRLLVWSGALHQ